MLPLHSKCYVQDNDIGRIEAICNNKYSGVKFSYCVRLHKNPSKLQWFDWDEVEQYSGPDPEENQNKAKEEQERSQY